MSANPTQFKRVAILFAGGPAPSANAVISTAAVSFIRNGVEVIGMKHGYSSLSPALLPTMTLSLFIWWTRMARCSHRVSSPMSVFRGKRWKRRFRSH